MIPAEQLDAIERAARELDAAEQAYDAGARDVLVNGRLVTALNEYEDATWTAAVLSLVTELRALRAGVAAAATGACDAGE